jgi:hypothetical protein
MLHPVLENDPIPLAATAGIQNLASSRDGGPAGGAPHLDRRLGVDVG